MTHTAVREWFFTAIGLTPHKTALAYLFPKYKYILGHCDSLKENSLMASVTLRSALGKKKKKMFKKGPQK